MASRQVLSRAILFVAHLGERTRRGGSKSQHAGSGEEKAAEHHHALCLQQSY
jgi:hypothetical protein